MTPEKHPSVVQDWLTNAGWKMQSIFFNGLRAPDAATKGVKKVVRWMRVNSCFNADPRKLDCYMSAPVIDEAMIQLALDELEYLPCHYVHHLADALRIIELFHPDVSAKAVAWRLHYLIAEEIFHFVPETAEQFKHRHRDKVFADESLKASAL